MILVNQKERPNEKYRKERKKIEVEKIYEDAINNSYVLQFDIGKLPTINAYWTGYFMGKVNKSVSDVSLDSFYAKVLIASQKLYDKREVA